ncbi:hypothetical protein [Aestuariivirga sp.]|uniref:hypothetical protein n=1 Tax=Aestuariivirga sp. TaxID=2650926 RepID=UPI00391B877C
MRVFVEAALVRHAAKHATPRDIGELRDALEANRAAIARQEHAREVLETAHPPRREHDAEGVPPAWR